MDQHVFVRLHAREGEEKSIEAALREVMAASRAEPGCLDFHIFRSARDPRLFFIHSRWADFEAYTRHADLPHTVHFLKTVDALVDTPREVTRTEMLA